MRVKQRKVSDYQANKNMLIFNACGDRRNILLQMRFMHSLESEGLLSENKSLISFDLIW